MLKSMVQSALGGLGYEIHRSSAVPRSAPQSAEEFQADWIDAIPGMISVPEAAMLYRQARAVSADHCIVEVGSFRGRSTTALGLGSLHGQQAPVYAIEPHEPFQGALGGDFGPEDRGQFYQTMLATGCYRAVRLVNLSSEQVTPGWTRPVGFLWIDGDHTYEGVRRDFDCWQPHLLPAAAVAFDDSLNPDIGPCRLIKELTDSGRYITTEQVGKVTMIRRAT